MGNRPNGILLTDKEQGETSHGVVKEVKALLSRGRPVKVGHAGTLDPFATGLLIILIGEGTKLSRFIMSGDKDYLATVELGVETDTLDPTGRVVKTAHVPVLDHGFVREKARGFVGKIQQVPPAYSAVRHKGTRAYKLARRGRGVELKAREVRVHSLEIIEIDLPLISMRVRCSSGTYIRSLAADLARQLGPGGHLRDLRRVGSGQFRVEKAVPSSSLMDRARAGLLTGEVMGLREALPEMGEIVIDGGLAEKIRHGYQPSWRDLTNEPEGELAVDRGRPDGPVKLVEQGKLIAIVRMNLKHGPGSARAEIQRVFSE